MEKIIYPKSSRISGSNNKKPVPLLLSGVGMRRKSFVVVAVDVYLIAINVSPFGLQKAKSWNPSSSSTLSELLLQDTESNR